MSCCPAESEVRLGTGNEIDDLAGFHVKLQLVSFSLDGTKLPKNAAIGSHDLLQLIVRERYFGGGCPSVGLVPPIRATRVPRCFDNGSGSHDLEAREEAYRPVRNKGAAEAKRSVPKALHCPG